MLRRGLRHLFVLGGRVLMRCGRAIYQTTHERHCQAWARDQGDKTLRLDYDLDPDSVVFDLGGYEGQWASDIVARYLCQVHVFEPVPHFAARIEERFVHNPRVRVHRLGLAGETRTVRMGVAGDSSSLFRQAPDGVEISLVRAADYLREQRIAHIDLMKVNIEGGEYELLDHLIDADLVRAIDNIQVQFHDLLPDSASRMREIHRHLSRTHTLTYQYLWVWENWRRSAGAETGSEKHRRGIDDPGESSDTLPPY